MNDQPKFAFDRNDLLDQQVAEILNGKTAAMVDPKVKHLVWALNKRRGAASAVKLDHLVKSLGVSERQVKQMVKDLVELYGLPVGASRRPPYGYYLAVTAEEIDDTCRNYFREAVSLFHRIQLLAGDQRMLEYHGQVPLELKTPGPPAQGPKEAA